MRLFLALNLPDAIRNAVWEVAEPLRRRAYPVRWVGPDAIHLTVKFLGDVDTEREADIVGGMRRAATGTRAFALHLGGFGAFPLPERARVIWVGCAPDASLELLQHGVEVEMERVGFSIEGRAFHPHLTLGRATRSARPADFRGLARDLEDLEYAADALVESLDLMESTLTPKGARYARRTAVPLT